MSATIRESANDELLRLTGADSILIARPACRAAVLHDAIHEFYNLSKGCDEMATVVTNVTEIFNFDMS